MIQRNNGRRLLTATTLGVIGSMATTAMAQTQGGDAVLEEIVITGTSIRGVEATGSMPLSVTQESIEVIAPRTTAELLATIPQVSQFNLTPTGSATFGATVAAISLRPNLPTGATLFLINGHRVVPSGVLAGLTDSSVISPVAIGRVDVLADGASSIYGSDAVGGVVNFITRNDLQGAETGVRGTLGQYDYKSYTLNQTFGTKWSTGSLFAALEYNHRDRLKTSKLDFYSNVGTTSGLNTNCPVATFGASTIGCDVAKWGDLQPDEDRVTVFAGARHELSDSIALYGDFIFSDLSRDQNEAMTSFPPTAMNAGNPFNPNAAISAPVFYRPIAEFGEGLNRTVDLSLAQLTAGLNFKLSGDWQIDTFLSHGKSSNKAIGKGLNNAAYQRAMAATTTSAAFDPFAHRTSDVVLSQILDGTDVTDVDQGMTQFSAKADGPLLTLPSGEMRLAVGAEGRRETQKGERIVGSPNSVRSAAGPLTLGYLSVGSADTDRDVLSALAELSVPLIGEAQGIPGIEGLTLSLAARYDDYSDAGDTTNPKVGLDWNVAGGLRLYGNWSKAFQAAPLGNTTEGAIDTRVQVIFGGAPPFAPTFAPYAGTTGLIIAGGSPNLQPQKSDNHSFGFEFEPTAWQVFRASSSYWHIDFKNYIGIPFPGTFTNPALSAYGILAPRTGAGGAVVPFTPTSPEVTRYTSVLPVDGAVVPGQVSWIAVLQRVNIARRVLAGVDFEVSQRFAVGDGALVARWAGTLLTKDDFGGAPGAALVDSLDTDNKLNYSVSLDYNQTAWRVGAQWNHMDSRYTSIARTFKVKPFDVVSLRAGYDFGSIEVTLNVDNAFDREPSRQIDANGGIALIGNTPQNPYGRLVTLGLKKTW